MNDSIILRNLGSSDLKLTSIGLGTWQFSKRKNLMGRFWPYLSEEESHEIVTTTFHHGVNWFDTAEAYGKGESEKTLSRALQHASIKDRDIAIATKWNPFFRTAHSINSTIDKRLSALHPYTISLYQVHNPYSFANIRSEMQAMASLIKKHKIQYVGVSNFSADQMYKAYDELNKHGIKLVSNQVLYSLVNRKIEYNGILEMAQKLGMAIIAYSPLAQGVLTGKYHENPDLIRQKKGFRKWMGTFKKKGLDKSRPLIEKLREIAGYYNVTPAQVALNWTVNYHGNTIFAIPGASNTQQAESNAKAMQISLSDADKNQIEQLSLHSH